MKRDFSEEAMIKNIIAIAERSIKRLRKRDPNEIYVVGGLSFGGPQTVANKIEEFERHIIKMRKQLKEVQRGV